jgi:hypothetical protein
MSRVLTTFAVACGALVLATSAAAYPIFGVSDDRGKYDDDGGAWFFSELAAAGLTTNKMTVNWDPARPTEIVEKPFLDRSIPKAEALGIHISLGIHVGKARAITSSPQALDQFTAWLQKLAWTYPQVTEYVVGNEPNLTRFWQPQYDSRGRGVSGIAFAGFLARSYDALKDVNPKLTVVGVGLSPRGNDMPNAKSNVSHSPVTFIRELGIGYGRMARNKPLMDVFGFHPYPARDRDPLAKGYAWPNAGVANLDRIKQAIWDAFDDTAQPTFAEGPQPHPVRAQEPVPPIVPPIGPPALPPVPGPEPPPEPAPEPRPEPEPELPPLTFKLDEVGWQVAIPTASRRAYYGRESVKTTTERAQAQIYGELVSQIACDPSVDELLFFGLVDEPNLDRWQAALVRADRTRRPAWETVRSAVHTGCTEDPVAWRHTEKVVGAKVVRKPGLVTVSAEEGATVRVAGKAYALRAYKPLRVRVSGRPLVELRAAMNPERSNLFR